VKEGWRSPVI